MENFCYNGFIVKTVIAHPGWSEFFFHKNFIIAIYIFTTLKTCGGELSLKWYTLGGGGKRHNLAFPDCNEGG